MTTFHSDLAETEQLTSDVAWFNSLPEFNVHFVNGEVVRVRAHNRAEARREALFLYPEHGALCRARASRS